ncbi:putative reverse transcriptase domain-containing protein [Tanacetum coccineum]|uniref:Reverse transcriptase domain-containing protein n=1 Tax=Tanacetum coccineum TaxID=301880 RepID=A0ABQ4YDX6_9ASTR
MPPKGMSAAGIQKLVADKVAEALVADRAARENADGSGRSEGQGGAPPTRECSFVGYMGMNEQFSFVVGLRRRRTEVKKIMTEEFCPNEEIQRMEDELRNLKLRDTNIVAYTQRFNELVLLCPDVVPTEKKKVEAYIKGLPENIKGETTSSKPVVLNDVVRMAHTLMEQKVQAKTERVVESNKRNRHNQYNNRRQGGARAMTAARNGDVDQEGPTLNCNHCGLCHFGNYPSKCTSMGTEIIIEASARIKATIEVEMLLGEHKSFVNTSFSHLIDINPMRLNTSYEVELADRKIVSTNTILRGCTLNLVNHLFEIDLMPIELSAFDVIIGMDWFVEHDAVIVCGKKVVHIPVKNKMLVVKGDSGVS